MLSLIKKFLNYKVMGVTTLIAGLFMLVGVIGWGAFNWSMELTNTEDFCISCHEMKDNVYQEYKKTIHYSNRSGVRATCPDCHVPKEWTYKIKRKIQASNELLHKALGTIDTPEKFNEKRLELAMHEWERMKETDSRECRNCHNFESMHQDSQKPRALKQHTNALQDGNTCIDCHKGIAHQDVRHLVDEELLEEMEAPNPEHAKPEAALHLFQRDLERKEKEKAEAEAKAAEEAKQAAIAEEKAKADAVAAAKKAKTAGKKAAKRSGGVSWSGVKKRQVTLFYPGQSSIEWIQKGSEHGGKRPFQAGDRCVECHDNETADMGQKIVTGEKLEDTVIPGKRGSLAVDIQAQHDADYLYMKFQWPNGKHAPVPFAKGGKMDVKNQMKLALMIGNDDVEYADRAGCWGSCHDDVTNMPGELDKATLDASEFNGRLDFKSGVTKYLSESRTKVESKGCRGKKLGGWDKLKNPEAVEEELAAGNFLDLIRYQSGTGLVEDGYILDERKMKGGQGAEVKANLSKGTWTVEMKRKLKSKEKGDISLELDKIYNIGFAIHDDYSDSRFHHVSLGYRMGFGAAKEGVEIVVKKK